MNVPDRIFAVGGAGKQLAFELLETQWVLEEILKPRGTPLETKVTIIDSAEGEATGGDRGGDWERVDDIKRRIRRIQEAYRDQDDRHRPGRIDVDYKLLTENIRLNRQLDMVGDAEVERITAGNGMDREDWWLRPAHINENLDFAKGVIRKRGLSKALYYKAYAEDDIEAVVDLPEKGEVAMLVGLGGGTGAGLLLDLVEHLKREQSTAEVTLFGVLPNNAEGEKENANAFAMLSELEYLSLSGADLFEDQILFSIEPTSYGGKADQMSPSVDYLKEFDEAFVYSLLLYYNRQYYLEESFTSSPYAPFTVAVPHLVRYNTEAIEEFRATVGDYLDQKSESMSAEKRLYDEVSAFLDTHYPESSGELSDEDKVDLERRIAQLETLISLELFEDLDYEVTSVFRTEVLDSARAELSADEREEGHALDTMIDIMVGSVEAGALENADSSSEEVLVADVLREDVVLLGRRKQILKRLKGVSDPKVRDALEYLVGLREGNAGAKSTQLSGEHQRAQTARKQAESELHETREELDELRAEQSEQVERKTDEWVAAVKEQFDGLDALESRPLRRDIETLRSSLQDFRRRVERARSPDEVEAIDVTEINEALADVEDDLQAAEVYLDASDVVDSVEMAKKARIAHYGMYADQGVSKYLPWESQRAKQRKSDEKQFSAQRAQLRNKSLPVFEVTDDGGEFTCTVRFDGQQLLDQVEERRETLRSEILSTFDETVPSPRPSERDRIADHVENGSSLEEIRAVVEEALERELADTGKLESRVEGMVATVDERRAIEELYADAQNAVTELNTHTEAFTRNLDAYQRGIKSLDETNPQQTAVEEEYTFRKHIQPHNIFLATGNSGLAESDVLDNRKEKQQLAGHVDELADKARSTQYCGLRKRKLIADQRRYDGIDVHVGLASEASLHGIVDLQSPFQNAFELDNSQYGQWECDFGGAWEIGMTSFITGVFLDNLRLMVGPEGYAEKYYEYESKLGDDILIHHAYGLEDGNFVRRKSMFNVEYTDDVRTFLQSDPEVTSTLLDSFERVLITDPSSDEQFDGDIEVQTTTLTDGDSTAANATGVPDEIVSLEDDGDD
ncbi:tubulin-like doman-containing protein [Haloferax profundi]|uniref:Tubulin like n=1 Tax=Haloferax profundi TaxID=1544718 RepID=A0A0W1SVM5_9EURY|nr:tubulin-like doman-containing protein [Haloferax profundi]KTG30497.1 hypothetical protein AUR66_07605 [Haloferax profundi]